MKNKRSLLILNDTVKQLKKIRIDKKKSHDALAEMVGVSRPAVSHIESGKRKPTLLMMLKLAHGLDTELSAILATAEKAYPE